MNKTFFKERAQHTTLLAPYKYYPSAIPDLSPLFPPHCHSEFEINYILDGNATFVCNNESFTASSGDVFIFLPNQIHGMSPLENQKIYYDTLLFKADILGPVEERGYQSIINPLVNGEFKIKLPISKGDSHYENIRNTIETVFASAKNNTAPMDILLKSNLLKFFYHLYMNGFIYDQQLTQTRYADIIRPALQYIEDHFAEELTVDELAGLIPLSKSYFMYCFKKATGIGTIAYATQIRIKKACELILNSDKPITQIAFECGFHNLANFNRLFKKNTGYSPLDYKKTFIQKRQDGALS